MPNLVQVPLGVDLAGFHPARADESLRSRLAPGGWWLLVHCSRLSPEKRPERAVGALAELRRRGVPAVLVIAGDGPRRQTLQARRPGCRSGSWGTWRNRESLAQLLATADMVIAPGPAETFGLSALEALASGTPGGGERPERPAGGDRPGRPGRRGQRRGVRRCRSQRLLRRDVAERRRLARQQAERFDWPTAVNGFLGAHGLTRAARR